jgi:hypothetical protein
MYVDDLAGESVKSMLFFFFSPPVGVKVALL